MTTFEEVTELLAAMTHVRSEMAMIEREARRIGEHAVAESDGSLAALITEIRAWQAATFPLATPASIAAHLLEEAQELADNPTKEDEMADIFILWCAATLNRDMVALVRRKFEIVKKRQWGEPKPNGVVNHIREGTREEEQ